jgi:gluconolactonase
MIFATDVRNPEGPVALPDGSWLIVEGAQERGCVTQLSADGRSRRTVLKTGRPNGLAVDADGFIWVAESKEPSLLRVSMDGNCEVIATGCKDEPFLFPNDLCFGPDGALYLTDSGVNSATFAPNNQIRSDYLEIEYDGRVYRIDPKTGTVTLLDRGIRFTNGIAFSPDDLLYVNETIGGNIYRYSSANGVPTGARQLFGNVVRTDPPPGWVGPDGMAFGEDGNLYVAVFGQGDVTVLGRDGQVVRRIATSGMLPTNLAFALPGTHRIHVTEYKNAQMETFDVDCDGLGLWNGRTTRQ